MRLLQGCVTLILLGIAVCEGNPYCQRRQSYAEIGRRCTKPCESDVDCTVRSEKCRCDGACGMSCFNPNANCAELEPLANGSRIVTTRIMGGKVYYRCNTGYVLKGSRRRTCNADKNWHPSAPTCEDYNNFGQTGGNRNVRAAPCLGRIVRGCSVKEATTWPSFVLITRKKSTPTKSLHNRNIEGGGSIINNIWILTAAHVLNGVNLAERVVFVGLWERPSRLKPLDSFVEMYSIAKYVEHPLFDDIAYYDNDIALFKLGRKLDDRMRQTTTSGDEGLIFGPRIRAISLPGCLTNGSESNRSQLHCSWSGEVVSNTEDSAIVVGFGHTKAALVGEVNQWNIIPPKHLQQATVTLVNRSLCQRELELGRTQVNIQRLQFTNNMLCYGPGPRSRTDACKGDSGGPLMEKVFDEQTKAHWVQIGIVSFGIGCASNYSGYYTKVDRYTSWIQNVLSEESSDPCINGMIYDNKCFIALIELVNYDGGVAICESRGGHLANIYSHSHMDDVMKYIRENRMNVALRLGMKYDPKADKLTLRDGTDAPVGLKWYPGWPFTVEVHGGSYADWTNVILQVSSDQSSTIKYLLNYPPSRSNDVLCEIE